MTKIDRYERINNLPEKDKLFAYHLNKEVPTISGIEEILGQDVNGVITPPKKDLKTNLKIMGHLLENDPKKVVSKSSVWIRKNLLHDLIMKQTKKDLQGKKHQMVKETEITEEGPIIFMPNHISKRDATATIIAAERLTYLVFGGLPIFYQTPTGLEAWINGSFVINRKNKESKQALIDKIIYGFECGLPGVALYPEASLNKTPNKLLLDYWKGVFVLAKKSGAKVVPLVHLELDDIIYSSRLKPIDFSNWELDQADEAMQYLREIVSTELYELMDQYAHTTREDIMLDALEKYKGVIKADIDFWQKKYPDLTRKQIIDSLITMDEVVDLTLKDQLAFVEDNYDFEIETTAHYQPKNVTHPETAFEPIVNACNVPREENQILKLIPKNYQSKY